MFKIGLFGALLLAITTLAIGQNKQQPQQPQSMNMNPFAYLGGEFSIELPTSGRRWDNVKINKLTWHHVVFYDSDRNLVSLFQPGAMILTQRFTPAITPAPPTIPPPPQPQSEDERP